VVHVDEDAVGLRLLLDVVQHLHPRGREEGQFIRLIALHAVDGRNLHRADACAGVFLQAPAHVSIVEGRAQPPPAHAGPGFSTRLRPRLGQQLGANCNLQKE